MKFQYFGSKLSCEEKMDVPQTQECLARRLLHKYFSVRSNDVLSCCHIYI